MAKLTSDIRMSDEIARSLVAEGKVGVMATASERYDVYTLRGIPKVFRKGFDSFNAANAFVEAHPNEKLLIVSIRTEVRLLANRGDH